MLEHFIVCYDHFLPIVEYMETYGYDGEEDDDEYEY